MGGFASAYDLVSSQYSWTDEMIGNLPLVRFRQIVAAIRLRLWNSKREEDLRSSWAVRTLSTFIAQGYMADKDGVSESVRAAQSLAYDEIEREFLKTDIPLSSPEPTAGSFERMMGAFGGLQKQGQMG